MTERERLVELLLQGELEAENRGIFNCHRSIHKAEIIADFLIENGVIVPPVAVSDMVFEIRKKSVSPSGRHTDHRVDTYKYLKYAVNTDDEFYIKPKQYRKSDISRLGKTVFMTREEAEKVLGQLEV